jgi:molybdopterin biosynthesis enzyme
MLSLEQALERILTTLPSAEKERISLAHGSDRFLAEPIRAGVDLPTPPWTDMPFALKT